MVFPRIGHFLAAIGILMIYSGFSGTINALLYPDQSLAYQFQVLDQTSSPDGFVPYYIPQNSASLATDVPGLTDPLPNPTAEVKPANHTDSTSTPQPAIPTQLAAELAAAPTVEPGVVYKPDRLVIPAIKLDASIIPSKMTMIKIGGDFFEQWQAPNEFAAGWNSDSAPLGQPGNTVLIGHHNEYGKVFAHLVDLKSGDFILLYSGATPFIYVVANTMIVPEKFQELDVRLQNARWVEPTNDERITLVTCWPPDNNTHRVIIVARPYR